MFYAAKHSQRPLDRAQQERFRPLIAQRIAEIGRELENQNESTQPVAPVAPIGRLSRLDSIQAQQMALAGRRRLADLKHRLHEAAQRIGQGNFGRCLLGARD